MFDKMKQLMEIKKQAEQIKRDLENTRLEVSDTQGIKILINGAQQFQSIEVSEELLGRENQKKLETDLLRALNNAIGKSQAVAAQRMKDMAGLNLPGF